MFRITYRIGQVLYYWITNDLFGVLDFITNYARGVVTEVC